MPLPWVADKDGKQFLCACKATSNPPFCDGSHAKPDVLKRYNRQLLEANSKLRDEVARITALLQDKTA